MTRAQIQALIDASPSLGAVPNGQRVGNLISLPNEDINLDGPLYLDNGIHLIGTFGTCLNIDVGPAVYHSTVGGHGYATHQSVRQLNINALDGDGIAVKSRTGVETVGVTGDASHLSVIDCHISAPGGTAMRYTNTEGVADSQVHFVHVIRTRVHQCGEFGVLICGATAYLDQFTMMNVNRTGSHPDEAFVKIYGVNGHNASAFIQNCTLTGKRGCPMFRLHDGRFVWKNNYTEPTMGHLRPIELNYPLIDGLVILERATLEADGIYFSNENNRTLLNNDSELFLTRDMILDTSDGDAATPRTAYVPDDSDSRLVYGGRTFYGQKIERSAGSVFA